MTCKALITAGIAVIIGLALLLAPSATASSTPPTNAKWATRTTESTAEKQNPRPEAEPNEDGVDFPQVPALPNAVDPALYRSLVDQMDAGPPQQLLDNQNLNQRNALTPPPPPELPPQFTQSDSPCREFGDTLNHAGAPLIPGAGLATNLLQHLCLLGSP